MKSPIDFFVLRSPFPHIETENRTSGEKLLYKEIGFSELKYSSSRNVLCFYFLLRMLGVIRSPVFMSYVISNSNLVAYALCYPKYKKYPFMDTNDYQIGAVFTDALYRKRGYGAVVLSNILNNMHDTDADSLWYLTDEENLPSMILAEKMGFSKYGSGFKTYLGYLPFISVYDIEKQL